jgi:hypothetical protein
MNTSPSPSAKEQVLDWVRNKNPQTLELKFGCKIRYGGITETIVHSINPNGEVQTDKFTGWLLVSKIKQDYRILGSDMGLQEFCRALTYSGFYYSMNHNFKFTIRKHPTVGSIEFVEYDDEQDLHNQSEEFYQAVLPLINDSN